MMLSQREFDVFKLLLHTARERKIEIVAAQQAAVAMVDSLAADLKGSGVRANSILPSIIDTAANRKAMPDADFSKWPKPREIANVILFLCSEEAKLVHGRDIPV
jgi:NAD(P)-dependent dehydrogenase (short-subunit alcohol dehydrogenase family)